MMEIMTAGGQQPNQNLVEHKAEIVAPRTEITELHPGLVKVLIKYPAKWKGPKFHKDGAIVPVSKESADQFVKAGFATIYVPASEEVKEEALETNPPPVIEDEKDPE